MKPLRFVLAFVLTLPVFASPVRAEEIRLRCESEIDGEPTTFFATQPARGKATLQIVHDGKTMPAPGSLGSLRFALDSFLDEITNPRNGEVSREDLGGDQIADLFHAIYWEGSDAAEVVFFAVDSDGRPLGAAHARRDGKGIRYVPCL